MLPSDLHVRLKCSSNVESQLTRRARLARRDNQTRRVCIPGPRDSLTPWRLNYYLVQRHQF
eukprot:scaffold425344_cov18-Prasinocladus_malaysianus.AAC.1